MKYWDEILGTGMAAGTPSRNRLATPVTCRGCHVH